MSLFQRFPSGEFAPLFRLLDDYDHHRTGSQSTSLRSFQPKFDVREIDGAYELHGELPGIDQKDVQIEFADAQTLAIKGRVEREFTAGDHPGAGRITGEVDSQQNNSHKATVEDDSTDNTVTPATSSDSKQVSQQSQPHRPKYWVAERSVGEFHRTFSFPSRVDQDAVKASMKNGILNIVVPKSTATQAKKITIE